MANVTAKRVSVTVRPLGIMLPDIPGHGEHLTLLVLVLDEENGGVDANSGGVKQGRNAAGRFHPIHYDLVCVAEHPNGHKVTNDFWSSKREGLAELDPGLSVRRERQ